MKKLFSNLACAALVAAGMMSASGAQAQLYVTGGNVDGQVLVVADMLGMTDGFRPRFLRRYADLHTVMKGAIGQYVEDVKSGDFPNENEQY